MLVVHIGLPKTGTTFLQHGVLAPARELAFVHRRRGRTEAALCAAFRRYAHASEMGAPLQRWLLLRRLRRLAEGRPVLVSDENISLKAVGFWDGRGSGPGRLAERLAAVARALDRPVRVILGIRRQDQWLASRYAESSKHFAGFGQADFDRRMAGLAAGPLEGPLGWLDYAGARAALAGALGAENVLVLPLERLASAPEANLAAVGGFLGGIALRPPEGRRKRRRNTLAIDDNTWRLRRDDAPLRLAPEVEAALRARFAGSNRALAEVVPLGFEP